MKIYKTQKEIEADIIDNVLTIKGDVKFEVSFLINAKIVVEAGNIEAWNIEAWNIKARNIKARNIKVWNIKAWNIEARNIEARNIKAGDISFWAVAFAYFSFRCKSINGRRDNNKFFCLDREVEIKK